MEFKKSIQFYEKTKECVQISEELFATFKKFYLKNEKIDLPDFQKKQDLFFCLIGIFDSYFDDLANNQERLKFQSITSNQEANLFFKTVAAKKLTQNENKIIKEIFFNINSAHKSTLAFKRIKQLFGSAQIKENTQFSINECIKKSCQEIKFCDAIYDIFLQNFSQDIQFKKFVKFYKRIGLAGQMYDDLRDVQKDYKTRSMIEKINAYYLIINVLNKIIMEIITNKEVSQAIYFFRKMRKEMDDQKFQTKILNLIQ